MAVFVFFAAAAGAGVVAPHLGSGLCRLRRLRGGDVDRLRQGIHLRGYAQKNPKQEYKREAFELFEGLLDLVRKEVTRVVFTVQIRSPEDVEETVPRADVSNVKYQHAGYDEALADESEDPQQPVNNGPKVGRNDPCPCGSGKKYKHCHGKLS